ncbi:MAG: ATP-binding protein [Candidatus Woesearchaeota archaeon]
MIQQFMDRKEEIKNLESFYKRKGPQLFVIYGRRRVGKTELIKQFTKNKPHIYFLADTRKDEFNIRDLQQLIALHFKDSLFEKANINSWYGLFEELGKKIGSKKIILVIDEFPYLIRANKAITSIFQKIIDEILSKTNIFLILCGSSISMMENEVLAHKSPLYGRRSGQWKVEPLKFCYLKGFFPRYKIEELVKLYSITDSIPLYLLKFEPAKSSDYNIINRIFKKGEFLNQEVEFLLKEELREPGNYFMILKAIAHGNRKFGEIINNTEMDKTLVSKYIDTLIKLRIIAKEFPVTAKKEKVRDTLYLFEDNYFLFWFRFVYPFRYMIEEGKGESLLKQVLPSFNQHVSFVFEKVCKEFLSSDKIAPFEYAKIGRWWHKHEEIDLVAFNDASRQIIFAECKWKNKVNADKELKALVEKSKKVKWNNGRRKEYYCIIAKSFKRKVKAANTLLFDLKDMQKAFF